MKNILRLPSILAALVLGPIVHSQSADSLVADARQDFIDSDVAAARQKLESAIAIDADHGDANALLAIARIALLSEADELQTLLGKIGKSSNQDLANYEILDSEQTFPVSKSYAQWIYRSADGRDGGDALAAGNLPPSLRSELTTTITGPGELSFWWANDLASWSDMRFSFWQDDQLVATFLNDSDWQRHTHPVPAGNHTFTWQVDNASSWQFETDKVYLDEVTYTPQGGNETPNDDGSSTGASSANALDNADLAWQVSGHAPFAPDASVGDLIDYLAGPFATEIEAAANNLGIAAAIDDYQITLTPEETGGDASVADRGDLLLVRSSLRLLQSLMLVLDSLDWQAELGTLNDLDWVGIDMQILFAAFPDLLTVESIASLPNAKNALQDAVAQYQAASEIIRARPEGVDRLFELYPEQTDAEADLREALAQLSAALDAPQTVDGETIDLRPLFQDGLALRALMPTFIFGKAVEGTFPDPTFQGILPDNTLADIQEYFADSDSLARLPITQDVTATSLAPEAIPDPANQARLNIGGFSNDGKTAVLIHPYDGVYQTHLLDTDSHKLSPIQIPNSDEPVELSPTRPLTYPSADGRYIFFLSSQPSLLPQSVNPPETFTLLQENDDIYFPHDEGGAAPSFQVNFAQQPTNAQTYPIQIDLTVEAYQEVTELTRLRFRIEAPGGRSTTQTLFIGPGQKIGTYSRPLTAFDSLEDWNGVWNIVPVSNDNPDIWSLRVKKFTMSFDIPPAQLYRQDIATGEIEIVSKTPAGVLSNGPIGIRRGLSSSDGRYVVFDSRSDSLDPLLINPNRRGTIFLKDMQTGALKGISATEDNVAEGFSLDSSITADGQKIAFSTSAKLDDADANDSRYDIYLHDVPSGSNSLLSVTATGTSSTQNENAGSRSPLISASGSHVLFRSNSASLANNDSSETRLPAYSLFLKDLATGTLTIIDTDPQGNRIENETATTAYDITADGSHIAFVSRKEGLVEGFTPTPSLFNLYLRDTQTNTTSAITDVQELEQGLSGQFSFTQQDELIAYTENKLLKLKQIAGTQNERYAFHYLPSGYVSFDRSYYTISEQENYISVPLTWHFTDNDPESITVELVTYTIELGSTPPQIDTRRTLNLTKASPTATLKLPIFQGYIPGYVGLQGAYIDSVEGTAIGPVDDTITAILPSDTHNQYRQYLAQYLPDDSDIDALHPFADLDEDGLGNYFEMLLGGNPLLHDSAQIFSITEDLQTGKTKLEMQVNTNVTIGIHIEFTNDLNAGWQSLPIAEIANVPGATVTDIGNGIHKIEFEANELTQNTDAIFFRLRIDP